MRPTSAILLLIAVTTHTLCAQVSSSFTDAFDDNRQGWPLENVRWFRAWVGNGKMSLKKDGGARKVVAVKRYTEPGDAYSLEAALNTTGARDGRGVGLVWGYSKATGEGHHFVLDTAGHFRICAGARDDVPWVRSSSIRDGVNTIRVEHRSGHWQFFINQILVHDMPARRWYDNYLGVVMLADGVAAVDNLSWESATPITVAEKSTGAILKESLGANVNSRYEDIKPVVTADNRHLYFARKASPENTGGSRDRQDVWLASSQDGISWTKAQNLGPSVNTPYSDNLCAVSADNNSMVFYDDIDHTRGRFVVRTRTRDGWSAPVTMGPEIVNESDFLESCLSADGNVLLFTAKKRENLAYRKNVDERDIYVMVKDNRGWSKPFNAGPRVNTAGDEFSPFLAADGRTLYFASDGRPGFGDVDLFMTRRSGDSWTDWSPPVNLGPGINTPDFDAYYTVPASGESAYMVSYHNSAGGSDIVRISVPPELRPEKVLLFTGQAIDAGTGASVPAQLHAQKASGEVVAATSANPASGDFTLILPAGTTAVLAEADGYLPWVGPVPAGGDAKATIPLIPLTPGRTVRLDGVLFEKGLSRLKPESLPQLDLLVDLLRRNPSLEIELAGHTDNVGTRESLLLLSRERVHAVRNYLTSKGIAARRISGRAYGPERPVQRNDTEANKALNRRVEFTILRI